MPLTPNCHECLYDALDMSDPMCAVCTGENFTPQSIKEGATRAHHKGQGRWDLLPMQALDGVAKVLEKGAEAHGNRNWEKGLPSSSWLSHAMRHLGIYISQRLGLQKFSGESISNEPHLYHAICNLLMLAETEARVKDGVLPKELEDYVD